MIDTLTPEARSRNMSRIRGKNTKPELVVRRILRSTGVGYRLHVKALPGCPDIVMAGRRRIIEVRGCFWHRHPGCRFAYEPKTRQEFWNTKLEANVARDRQNEAILSEKGWHVLVIWECEIRDLGALRERISCFLEIDPTNCHPAAIAKV
ncbi:very short patch repair endonuclease [Methylobacterium marchantiae]|uniref:Very short patch repair endonuclease n=1 Tax=Methylobacterium marchantiae TaxID=600331 RepID=A0ABW3X3Y5_9HYPH